MNYGAVTGDFAKCENLADASYHLSAGPQAVDWLLRVEDVNDGAQVTARGGRYQPNAWGLFDMHGNVAEWTRSAYRSYPYDAADGREEESAAGPRVARGGSYADRPVRARSAFRLAYEPWQAVHNVGLRVVCEPEAPKVAAK